MENWKQITSAPNGYMVSDLGRVEIPRKKSTIITTGTLTGSGYLMVGIAYEKVYVHRLVAEHFCDGPNEYECVNHLNGIKTDNRAVNLEKTTFKANQNHAAEMGLNNIRGAAHPMTKLSVDDVLKVYELKKNGKRLHEVAKIVEIPYGALKDIYSGKNWKYEYHKFFGESYRPAGKNHGEVCGRSIPKEKVIAIYELKKQGKRIFEIAKELDLKFHTVKEIFHGKNWKHLYKEHFN